jgi:lysozyme
MTLSPLGIALIQFFEDYAPTAYRRYPSEPWTCGWGHTGVDVVEGTTCTEQKAMAWLISDTSIAASAVLHDVKVSLSQHQFDALVSLVYNIGQVVLQHRSGEVWVASTLLTRVNSKQYPQAAEEFLEWDHVNGVPDKGVLRRRELERALFLDGTT